MQPASETHVTATAVSGSVQFANVTLAENEKVWLDRDDAFTRLPSQLLGGTLLRCSRASLKAGTAINVSATGGDVRIYAAVEVSPMSIMGKHLGGMARAFASTPRWIAENSEIGWGDERCEMTIFSTYVQAGVAMALPEVKEDEAALILVAVPIVTGSFALSIVSSNAPGDERLTIMEEGVVAWRDRDHRFAGVPPALIGGVLYQGVHKDVPHGTVMSVRPNMCARVYVVCERASSGGLVESLPAKGWTMEDSAPRWHDLPTMVMFSCRCTAGCLLKLPATAGSGAIFSIIVCPSSGTLVAPVEATCMAATGESVSLDLVPLANDTPAWHDSTDKLICVPDWMCGATLVRGSCAGPPVGSTYSLRAAAPSVVYVVLEEAAGMATAARSGGLPQALLAAGWERREGGPRCLPNSTLAVFARRVGARQPLCTPAVAEAGALMMVVVKVDIEAFDARVETNGGLDFPGTPCAETCLAWSDRPNRYAWLPPAVVGGTVFRGPFDALPSGTVLRVRGSGAFRAYVIVEVEYQGGQARSGGYAKTLPTHGWRLETGNPSCGDLKSKMAVFSRRAHEGEELVLPATVGEAVFNVVVVNVASGADRLADELRYSFEAWDKEGKGGLRREDLDGLLRVLCPDVDAAGRAALLSHADSSGKGIIGYAEFARSVMLT
eukprot:TRINITY_DN17872_c1_g3_i1.p1 TRINITY_DN17872_c1_g3~~TRINITY_DN17872_c1_g3_i1.p1  ORF type:complete len:666 (-),score=152.66 TRINITY_DN17872_c1_g3_i1:83-2080(-)